MFIYYRSERRRKTDCIKAICAAEQLYDCTRVHYGTVSLISLKILNASNPSSHFKRKNLDCLPSSYIVATHQALKGKLIKYIFNEVSCKKSPCLQARRRNARHYCKSFFLFKRLLGFKKKHSVSFAAERPGHSRYFGGWPNCIYFCRNFPFTAWNFGSRILKLYATTFSKSCFYDLLNAICDSRSVFFFFLFGMRGGDVIKAVCSAKALSLSCNYSLSPCSACLKLRPCLLFSNNASTLLKPSRTHWSVSGF